MKRALSAGVLFSVFALPIFGGIAHAQSYVCGFIQDKLKGGNSNVARCALDVAKDIFAPADKRPPSTHCDSPDEGSYTDYKIEIDERASTAKFRVTHGFTERGEESLSKINALPVKPTTNIYVSSIVAKEVGTQLQSYDSLSNEPLERPVKVLVFHYILKDRAGEMKYLSISKESGKAAMITTVVLGTHTWIETRFGTCQKQ